MKKTIRVRCWIDLDDIKFFGPGRAELLLRIREEGSISQAAKSMGMSYKKAWGIVDQLNSMRDKPMVVARKGGEKGGRSEVTEEGLKIVEEYLKLIKKIDEVVAKNSALLNLI